VASGDRILQILALFSAVQPVLTPARAMAALGVSRASAYRYLQRLEAAVELEKAGGSTSDDDDQPAMARRVTLRQRAFPLIEMLRAARKRAVDVTWGI